MRFLILTQYFPPEIGAPQIRLAAMARELVRQGHEVEVVTALPNYPSGKIFPEYQGSFMIKERMYNDIIVHRTWVYPAMGAGIKRLLNYSSFAVTSLFGLVQAQRPDYLFVESPPLFLSIPAYLWAWLWRRNVPIILNIADLWPDTIYQLGLMKQGINLRLARILEQWSYRKARFITVVTEGMRGILIKEKRVPPEKILFLPNGVDVHMFLPRKYNDRLAVELGLQSKKVILYAGTLGIVHGLETAIYAIHQVRKYIPQVMLVFIGDGTMKKELQRLVTALSLSENVLFLEPASPEYVAQLFSIADIGLAMHRSIPLLKSARSSKIFPIMASGKPVLYSGEGEGARLVQQAQAGIVVPPENPEALAKAIYKLISNPRLAHELGRKGRSFVEKNFSWSTLVKNWLVQLSSAEAKWRGRVT